MTDLTAPIEETPIEDDNGQLRLFDPTDYTVATVVKPDEIVVRRGPLHNLTEVIRLPYSSKNWNDTMYTLKFNWGVTFSQKAMSEDGLGFGLIPGAGGAESVEIQVTYA